MSVSEQQLKELAQRLGDEAEAGIDVEETAAVVVGRLGEKPAIETGWRRHMPVLGACAAAAVVALVVGIIPDRRPNQFGNIVDLTSPQVALQALSFDELQEMYDSLSFEAPVSELSAASLDDLSIGQLEELLEALMED